MSTRRTGSSWSYSPVADRRPVGGRHWARGAVLVLGLTGAAALIPAGAAFAGPSATTAPAGRSSLVPLPPLPSVLPSAVKSLLPTPPPLPTRTPIPVPTGVASLLPTVSPTLPGGVASSLGAALGLGSSAAGGAGGTTGKTGTTGSQSGSGSTSTGSKTTASKAAAGAGSGTDGGTLDPLLPVGPALAGFDDAAFGSYDFPISDPGELSPVLAPEVAPLAPEVAGAPGTLDAQPAAISPAAGFTGRHLPDALVGVALGLIVATGGAELVVLRRRTAVAV